jgi:predicted transcriptional regulator
MKRYLRPLLIYMSLKEYGGMTTPEVMMLHDLTEGTAYRIVKDLHESGFISVVGRRMVKSQGGPKPRIWGIIR